MWKLPCGNPCFCSELHHGSSFACYTWRCNPVFCAISLPAHHIFFGLTDSQSNKVHMTQFFKPSVCKDCALLLQISFPKAEGTCTSGLKMSGQSVTNCQLPTVCTGIWFAGPSRKTRIIVIDFTEIKQIFLFSVAPSQPPSQGRK